MLVAEEVAHRTGQKLDFKDWDGDDGGKGWARSVRAVIAGKDAEAEVVDESEAGDLEATPELPLEDILANDAIEPAATSITMPAPGGYDSDDSLTGYQSPPSSRSPSPTPSELDEIEKDPTLRVDRKKIPRPVYLAQLGELIRGSSGLKSEQENQEADKHEVALDVAEELIRRKRGYGTELG